MTPLDAVLTATAAGAITGWGAGPLLRRSREPLDRTDKPLAYAELATANFRVSTGLVAAAASLTAVDLVPIELLPLWLVGSTFGVLAACVDGVLTWVPTLISHASWTATVLALACVVLLGASWTTVATIAATALAAGFALQVVWRITYPDLGFADVRFAPVAAAIAASAGLTNLPASALCTSVAAAVHLLTRRARGQRSPQPYIPAMLAGPFIAELLTAGLQ